jgi:hypothetical protein
MNKILIIFSLILLAACGPSQEEKEKVAAVTCSIMGETRNMDAAVRVEKMNEVREKIGGEAFLRGDDAIKEAFEYDLCQELVLNKFYDETLQPLKDAKRERERIAAEKLAEEKRIATEKLAEEKRIATEKLAEEQRKLEEKRVEEKRLADSKPTVKDYVLANGIRRVENYQSKTDGGKKHGWDLGYYPSGKLRAEQFYVDGQSGIYTYYLENGQIYEQHCYVDGTFLEKEDWADTPICNPNKDLSQ